MSTATVQRPQTSLVPERMPVEERPEFFAALEADDKPVIFTGAMKDWPAARQWTFDWFAREHGDVSAPVEWLQYGRRASGGVERVGRVRTMTIRDYVATLKEQGSAEVGYLIGNDLFHLRPSLKNDVRFAQYPVERRLTEQLFFMGPRGAFTQLHMDRAHNLHAVMVGRKQWQLYAPSREAHLKPAKLDHVWSVVSDYDLVPGGGEAHVLPNSQVPDYDFVLEAGEILYLPYGWWHRVLTVESAIATNYWWWTWPMLARIGPRLIPSLAVSVLGRMRKQSVYGRRFREQ